MKFDQKYNQDTFSAFLRDFLPEDYVEKEKDIADLSRAKIITSARELGHSPSLDAYVLEMTHAKETDPRVSIATDAFKILATFGYDKALVIFKNNDSENYRFSYLTISLDLNEKSKVVAKYSNARRFSFLLGSGAKTKTPHQQLIKRGRVKDAEDLADRFSLEVVNKEFYLQVAKLFDALVGQGSAMGFSLPSVSPTEETVRKNFAVRLIGRLMFCWFLKQKQTARGQLVPDELLSSSAVAKHDGYYHAVLEPLFFEVLNTPLESRDIRTDLFDQVPYLNGGLFSPQRNDYYEFDRAVFASRHINTLLVPDEWFVDFFGLLETYNFTIDENTVFDQELSVDPEMLGRIFENLLAEIDPDTGNSERKRTGSFYTPRQIVDYMVDASLAEYLQGKTAIQTEVLGALISYDPHDDVEHPLSNADRRAVVGALSTLKALDPACGSGAFPIGILQKIVHILQQVDPDCELWVEEQLRFVPELWKRKSLEYYRLHPPNYTRKLDVIKSAIFGVDIQPIAVEVSRLRCFLTLVVESEIRDDQPNRGIEALPNLDFKFVCANTLIPAPEQIASDSQLFGDDFQERLASAVDRYFVSFGESKRSANNEIHRLIDGKVDEKLKYLNTLISYDGSEKLQAVLARQNKKTIDQHAHVMTLWSSYKNIFENEPVGFFDPKYFFPSVRKGFDIVIGNPPYAQVKNETIPKETYPYAAGKDKGKQNLYKVFVEFGYNAVNPGGTVCFITQNSLMADISAEFTRELLLTHTQISRIIEFPKAIKGKDSAFDSVLQGTCIILFKKVPPAPEQLFLLSVGNGKSDILNLSFETIAQADILHFYEHGKYFPLVRPGEFAVVKHMVEHSKPLKMYVANASKGDFNLAISSDKFSQDKTPIKMYRGKHVHRFFLDKDTKEFMEEGFKDEVIEENAEHQFFLSQNITGTVDEYRLHFALTRRGEQFLCGDSTNKFRLKDESANLILLGILNSHVMDWYFRKTSTNNHVNGYELEVLPIPDIYAQKDRAKQIGELAERIVERKQVNPVADTSAIEKQIDELVMSLYNLTDEEISMVIENSQLLNS